MGRGGGEAPAVLVRGVGGKEENGEVIKDRIGRGRVSALGRVIG